MIVINLHIHPCEPLRCWQLMLYIGCVAPLRLNEILLRCIFPPVQWTLPACPARLALYSARQQCYHSIASTNIMK